MYRSVGKMARTLGIGIYRSMRREKYLVRAYIMGWVCSETFSTYLQLHRFCIYDTTDTIHIAFICDQIGPSSSKF